MGEPSSQICDVAIIGGGCSGVLVAARLLRGGFEGSVVIVEERSELGRGLAYSTPFQQHLLNVPARGMSACPSQPTHFVDWLRSNYPSASPDCFVPRSVYGGYLKDFLLAAERSNERAALRHVRNEVIDIHTVGSEVDLILRDQSRIRAAKVVLAVGNPQSSPAGHSGANRWASPWDEGALQVRHLGERILLIGTGLTAVDSALALLSSKHPCSVFMLSRRGLLPQAHTPAIPRTASLAIDEAQGLRRLTKELRAHVRASRETGACWRAIVDGLRSDSNRIWQKFSIADRKRFLRHLKPYWETHRHRMAPEIARALQQFRAQNKIEVIAGRVRDVDIQNGATALRILLRGAGERSLRVDRVINCTGIQDNFFHSCRPLIRTLVEKGMAKPHPLGVGLETDELGALLNAEGEVSSSLFTLGPPRSGHLLETTAVPELRVQARALAQRLLNAPVAAY